MLMTAIIQNAGQPMQDDRSTTYSGQLADHHWLSCGLTPAGAWTAVSDNRQCKRQQA